MVSQGPKLLHGGTTGKGGVPRNHILKACAPHKIIIQVPLVRAKHIIIPGLFPKIKVGLIMVIKKDAVCAFFL